MMTMSAAVTALAAPSDSETDRAFRRRRRRRLRHPIDVPGLDGDGPDGIHRIYISHKLNTPKIRPTNVSKILK